MTEYWLFDPSGNITALIPLPDDTPCDPSAAEAVMRAEPSCEQAGFVLSGPAQCDARLEMAGGEFCGNASLCTAALTALRTGVPVGDTVRLRIAASGAESPVSVSLERREEFFFTGSIAMPPVTEIRDVLLPGQESPLPVVFMPGIAHTIVPEAFGLGRAEAFVRDWCAALNVPAMGILLTDSAFTRLTPLVYVPAVHTLYRENSCASGSAAAGALMASRQQSEVSLCFTEPGGTLFVTACPDGSVTLRNTVRLLRQAFI